MSLLSLVLTLCTLLPALWMAAAAGAADGLDRQGRASVAWSVFRWGTVFGVAAALAALVLQALGVPARLLPGLATSLPVAWLALLVQFLGMVIGAFAQRYLQGEAGQGRAVRGFAGVLGAVQLLLLADHWLILLPAWALVGQALHGLLCFYPERPFAQLAAHKKRVSDRLADGLLLLAAGAAWTTVGSGSISAALAHAPTPGLSLAAVALALAVIVRMALVPLHGWLLQVMEAPTPVSALLHAGVVNLGGFVLIRFAPWLEASPLARGLLVVAGLGSALLAAFGMLTRISIKVRLAWSTVAQMGFLVLECGLGLYHMAALHLIGHSLYKAHHFLAAADAVRETREQMLGTPAPVARWSLWLAPAVAGAAVLLVLQLPGAGWPGWWTVALALAWAPLLWQPAAAGESARARVAAWGTGLGWVLGLTLAAWVGHQVPLGMTDQAHPWLGLLAVLGLGGLYLGLAALQWQRGVWSAARRWTYAGYYVDDGVTRLACRLWPSRWAAGAWRGRAPVGAVSALRPVPLK